MVGCLVAVVDEMLVWIGECCGGLYIVGKWVVMSF
jgi:hypothetical protein